MTAYACELGQWHAQAHRFAAPESAQLREPPRTGHRCTSTCCVYKFLQTAVHRDVQINLLLRHRRHMRCTCTSS